MRIKLLDRESKCLCAGGRITRVKSFLTSMPLYLLQILKPSSFIVKRLERICYLHAGGFTFGWNLWWKFKAQESLWAWVMKAKQCQNSHPRIAQPRSHDSYNWRILLAVRGDAKLNITWRLGAGKISF